jgi:hypothetical protein
MRDDYIYEDAIKKLEKLTENSDYEVAHIEADDVLCTVLRTMGYNTLVDTYDRVGKWYA